MANQTKGIWYIERRRQDRIVSQCRNIRKYTHCTYHEVIKIRTWTGHPQTQHSMNIRVFQIKKSQWAWIYFLMQAMSAVQQFMSAI